MSTDSDEVTWMNDQTQISFVELVALSGLSDAALRELVESGALVPVNPDEAEWRFSAHCEVLVRAVGRLHIDFDLEPSALALTLSLLERIHGLEAQLRALQAQAPRRVP